MDGSIPRKSDAATTRKRRSSILKSQRAPRTPFSELEFNVATPTDAKSRRVSFSARNGVAEFEITEATTAWRNVYEEHNNALEASVNDSDSKGEKRPLVAHLSNRTGLMFEEEEADVIVASTRELVTSFNGLRDNTNDEGNLSVPRRQYDLSECTHQRTEQLFDNDANPIMKEMTDQIDLNFSAMVPISDQELDLIQDRKSNRMSYIDADLNETHISLKGNDSDVSDMSITDTIHSPKVAASKVKPDVDDWVADKENVVVNPYVAPLPAENFAVANDSDDVLVFDGKKCKFQSDLKTDLPDVKAPEQNKRKTIVYNDDDGDISMTQAVSAQILIPHELNSTSRKMNATVFESNISMTQTIPSNVIISNEPEIKQQTIYFNDLADISVTETVPSSALEVNKEPRRKTIVYEADEGHVSMTEAVPANMIFSDRRKTILYQNDEGDISMTQAVPVNIIQTNNPISDKTKTIVYDADELEMTQAVPANVLLTNKCEKRKTILFADDDGNMSITQAIPAQIMRPNDSRPDKNIENIPVNLTNFEVSLHEVQGKVKEMQECIITDVTRLCSEAMLNDQNDTETNNKRKTIVFDDDEANVSITQALPVNILDPVPPVFNKSFDIAADMTIDPLADSSVAIPIVTEDIIVNNTALREKEINDTSLTNSPLPDSNVVIPIVTDDIIVNNTALREKEINDTSLTNSPLPDSGVAIPVATDEMSVNNTALREKEINDTSLTNSPLPDSGVAIPVATDEMSLNNTALTEKEPTLQLNHTAATNSIVPSNVLDESKCVDKSITQVGRNKTITISYDDSCTIPITNPIPAHMISIENDHADKTKEKLDKDVSEIYNATLDKSKPGLQSIIVYEATIKLDKSDDVSGVQGAEIESNEALEPSPSDTSTPHQVVPEPMEQENSSDSAESMLDIRDDLSIKSTKLEKDRPVVVQASVLNVLLDMSNASMDGEQADKTGTMKMTSESSFGKVSTKSKESQESYLLIKDSDSEPVNVQNSVSCKPVTNQPLPIEFENDKPQTVVEKVKEELGKIKISIKRSPKLSESPEMKPEPKHESKPDSPLAPKANVAAKDANDTKYLLDMLSQLSQSRNSRDFTPKDDEKPVPIEFDGKLAIENKTEPVVRRSMVPDRKSMVRSREDLLKDISMAQAMLEFNDDEEEDYNEPEESANETTEILEESSPARSVRMSNEVVKTLRFDDEVDESFRKDVTPLKKTAFANTAQLADSKTKVIPEYMSYVSDLKGIMNDLTKPMADIDKVPAGPRKCASTCSTQIQANLITSSQIDLVTEQDSSDDIVPQQDLAPAAPLSKTVGFIDEQSIRELSPLRLRSPANRVVLFDRDNPLNNVLLPTIDACEAHPYNPRMSGISLNVSHKSNTSLKSDTQNNIESRLVLHNTALPSGDASPGLMSVKHSFDSTRPSSIDQSVDTAPVDLRDRDVNTVIAMKRNHELLNANSSLTLVDDMMQSGDESNSPSPPSERSRVKVIFKGEDDTSYITDDLNSIDDDASTTQAKKRLYSPANREKKHCTFAIDGSPKPAVKVQKISDSPTGRRKSVLANSPKNRSSTQKRLEDSRSICKDTDVSKQSPGRKSCSPIFKRSETAMTIHQLITKYNLDGNMDKKTLAHQLLSALSNQSGKSENSLGSENTEGCKSLDLASDCGSRRDLRSESGASERSGSAWRPELLNEMSSKNLVAQCDSGVNVIPKIDVLPFMGSSECEWESRVADAWSVRFLRGRIRLLVRLEHRHDNATRTCVRADTRVRDTCVQPVEYDSDDPIAVLCVRFAAETMRHLVSRGCQRAGDVPALLRRCAAVARVALRWARAMHAARTHLAYTLTRDGRVSLKVANIPLRSVWEVTLRIELVSELDEPPTPLALDVGAARVVSEYSVPPDELARALAPLPRDWGHAPRALWKIFKHLKHKTLDEDVLVI